MGRYISTTRLTTQRPGDVENEERFFNKIKGKLGKFKGKLSKIKQLYDDKAPDWMKEKVNSLQNTASKAWQKVKKKLDELWQRVKDFAWKIVEKGKEYVMKFKITIAVLVVLTVYIFISAIMTLCPIGPLLCCCNILCSCCFDVTSCLCGRVIKADEEDTEESSTKDGSS